MLYVQRVNIKYDNLYIILDQVYIFLLFFFVMNCSMYRIKEKGNGGGKKKKKLICFLFCGGNFQLMNLFNKNYEFLFSIFNLEGWLEIMYFLLFYIDIVFIFMRLEIVSKLIF